MKKINRNFKKCLITGIAGSGGSYLAEFILKKDKKKLKFMVSLGLINIKKFSKKNMEKKIIFLQGGSEQL